MKRSFRLTDRRQIVPAICPFDASRRWGTRPNGGRHNWDKTPLSKGCLCKWVAVVGSLKLFSPGVRRRQRMSYIKQWDDDNNNDNVGQRCYGFGYSVSFAYYVGELRLRNKKKGPPPSPIHGSNRNTRTCRLCLVTRLWSYGGSVFAICIVG